MGERTIPPLSWDAPDYSAFIGKYLIIGLTFLDEGGDVIEQFQIHGPIVAINDRQGIVIDKPDGTGTFAIPPAIGSLEPARRGQYRLRGTGEIVDDPDFTTNWTIERTKAENLDDYKHSGFGPFSFS